MFQEDSVQSFVAGFPGLPIVKAHCRKNCLPWYELCILWEPTHSNQTVVITVTVFRVWMEKEWLSVIFTRTTRDWQSALVAIMLMFRDIIMCDQGEVGFCWIIQLASHPGWVSWLVVIILLLHSFDNNVQFVWLDVSFSPPGQMNFLLSILLPSSSSCEPTHSYGLDPLLPLSCYLHNASGWQEACAPMREGGQDATIRKQNKI